MPGEPTSAELSPWVALLAEPGRGALRRLLGLDSSVEVTFRPRGAPPVGRLGTLYVSLVFASGIRLELELREQATSSSRRPWFERAGLSVSYRRDPSGDDPWAEPARRERLAAVRCELERAPLALLTERLSELVTELERVERSRELDDRMLRQISAGSAGKNATLRLGFRCNQACGLCWQARDWPDPPEELCRQWLEEIAAAGIRQLVLSGGEPTLYPGLVGLVRRASELGLVVELQTNALALRKPALLEALHAAGLRQVFVSYHSHLPALSDAMTRAPGTHAGTEAGIAACLRAQMSVQLNTVVERANVRDLPEHAAAIVARFVDAFPDNPVRAVTFSHPTSYHDRALWRASVVPLDEVAPRLVAAARILEARGVEVDASGAGCGFPACVLRDEPRLIRRCSPSALDQKDREARQHPAPCAGCVLLSECIGVRREYQEVHGLRGIVPF